MNDEKYLDWSKLPAFTRELMRAGFQDIDIIIGILWYRYFSLDQENKIGINQLKKDLDYAGFMNSCALLCRRIFEILLIKAFKENEFENDIIDSDYYFPLGKLINLVNSGNYFKVTKETKQILDHQLDIGIRELLEKANIQMNESQDQSRISQP